MIRIKRLNESNSNDISKEEFENWLDGESNYKIVDRVFLIAKTIRDTSENDIHFLSKISSVFYKLLNNIRWQSNTEMSEEEIYKLEPNLIQGISELDNVEYAFDDFIFYNSIIDNMDSISDFLTEIEDNGFKWEFVTRMDSEYMIYDELVIYKHGLLREDLDKLASTITIINSLLKRIQKILHNNVRIESINNWQINIYLRG